MEAVVGSYCDIKLVSQGLGVQGTVIINSSSRPGDYQEEPVQHGLACGGVPPRGGGDVPEGIVRMDQG
jgi:hypothetical protein